MRESERPKSDNLLIYIGSTVFPDMIFKSKTKASIELEELEAESESESQWLESLSLELGK